MREQHDPGPPDDSTAETLFDELRIRQVTVLRRGLYRSRSYAVIAAVVCAATAAQGGYSAWQHARAHGWELRPILFLLLALCASIGAVWFARRSLALSREAKRSHLPEPSSPPDFSTLSDGSQRARHLDQIQ